MKYARSCYFIFLKRFVPCFTNTKTEMITRHNTDRESHDAIFKGFRSRKRAAPDTKKKRTLVAIIRTYGNVFTKSTHLLISYHMYTGTRTLYSYNLLLSRSRIALQLSYGDFSYAIFLYDCPLLL